MYMAQGERLVVRCPGPTYLLIRRKMEMDNKRAFNLVEIVAGGVVANTKSHAKEKVYVLG